MAEFLRTPVVSGSFYPASAVELKRRIESFPVAGKKTEIIGCMLPHAGYEYSGAVATQTVSGIRIREKIILLGPNHTGMGEAFSVMADGVWQTPLGDVRIDSSIARQFIGGCKYLKDDTLAHLKEHSLEVELPILQFFNDSFQIVPISISSDELVLLQEIGKALGKTIKESGNAQKVMFVASSDMTHYESAESAKRKDAAAIGAILELNEEKLAAEVRRLNITMCGFAPVVVMLSAVKTLGAKTARLIKYQTSGDVTGDNSAVVGYAGIVIE